MARGQPTFVADRDPVQKMVERPEVAPAEAGHVGEALGKGQRMVAKPTR